MVGMASLIYRRTASEALMAALTGSFAELVTWVQAEPGMRDLQLRQAPKGKESWASLYVGLTSVLDVYERDGRFQLRAHNTHRKAGGFLPAWSAWQGLDAFDVPAVLAYVMRAAELVEGRWLNEEGGVQAVIANRVSEWSILNRETSLSFRDDPLRRELRDNWRAEVTSRLSGIVDPPEWLASLAAKKRGLSPDFLAIDDAGRLLVVEAKPAGATDGITGGPAQVALYARMVRTWIDSDPAAAVEELRRQLGQRVSLGLSRHRALMTPVQVVPVLVLGWGLTSPEAWNRVRTVATAVLDDEHGPLEIYRLAESGELTRWDYSASVSPVPTEADWAASDYSDRARVHAVTWKLAQGVEADGPYGGHLYPFCLPVSEVHRNLLPASQGATAFFEEQGILWHRGVKGGPTTHLVSSQVQCVNALYPLSEDDIKHVFSLLDIATVEEMDGRLITFEYGGRRDYLNEVSSTRLRGAHSTSADAAFAFVNSSGGREIALIEWKYTEQYQGHQLSMKKAGVREERYRALWEAGELFHTDVLDYADMFYEPFYQLMRQQMLAYRMEEAGEASRVTVVHISPAGNAKYQQSLTERHAGKGATVKEVWGMLLKKPDRFTTLDSKVFWDVVPGFRERYGHE